MATPDFMNDLRGQDLTQQESHLSWGAIIAGAVVGLALGTMLNMLGFAIAATMTSATSDTAPSARTLAVMGGVWLALTAAIGLFAGGVVAARFAPRWNRTDAALHGVAVWGVGTIIAAVLVGSALSGGVAASLRGLGGAAAGAGQAAAAAVSQIDPAAAVERWQSRLTARQDITAENREDAVAEATQLMLRRLRDGSWQPADRQRMDRIVASLSGLSQAEAAERVNTTEREIVEAARRAEQVAREAADAAASTAAIGSFWSFAALLLSLAAAILGARAGMAPTPPGSPLRPGLS